MFEILSYSFFQYALIAGVLVASIASLLGPCVVLRREPNTTHAIAHILFLGMVVSLFFGNNYHFFALVFALFGVGVLFWLESVGRTSRESSKEIISQMGMAGGVFLLGILGSVQIDVMSLLFGNILLIAPRDLWFLAGFFICLLVIALFFGKRFLRIILAPDMARSTGMRVWVYELGYLFLLTFFLSQAMSIFGILLVGAFLVLPANIGKHFGTSLRQMFIIAFISGILAVILGLFSSYVLDTSAGATMVLLLGLMFLMSVMFGRRG